MVEIKIFGPCASGKTTIAEIITKALKAHNINVINNDIDVSLHTNYTHLQYNRINAIASAKRLVTIECVQVKNENT